MNESSLPDQPADGASPAEPTIADRSATRSARAKPAAIMLKPVQESDEAFLRAVYTSARSDEMALTGWALDQQNAFLRMQFDAQKQSYSAQFPRAQNQVIEWDGVPCGRLIVDRSSPEILLIDIALLSHFRQKGIGSVLMSQLMEEGMLTGKGIRLHVERFNPILPWYQRLGFKTTAESAIYLEMLWSPRAATSTDLSQAEPCI